MVVSVVVCGCALATTTLSTTSTTGTTSTCNGTIITIRTIIRTIITKIGTIINIMDTIITIRTIIGTIITIRTLIGTIITIKTIIGIIRTIIGTIITIRTIIGTIRTTITIDDLFSPNDDLFSPTDDLFSPTGRRARHACCAGRASTACTAAAATVQQLCRGGMEGSPLDPAAVPLHLLQEGTGKQFSMSDYCFTLQSYPKCNYDQLREFLVMTCKRKLQYIPSSIDKDQVLRETFYKVQTLLQKNVFLLVDEVQIHPTV
ncbi:hypothetical protein FHG87_025283 [Trinorchestia longiramus]|nr:hypothetical protein FHG87_025283 [Trinorchestia longiramus]